MFFVTSILPHSMVRKNVFEFDVINVYVHANLDSILFYCKHQAVIYSVMLHYFVIIVIYIFSLDTLSYEFYDHLESKPN